MVKIVVPGNKPRDLEEELDELYEALDQQGIVLPVEAQERRRGDVKNPHS